MLARFWNHPRQSLSAFFNETNIYTNRANIITTTPLNATKTYMNQQTPRKSLQKPTKSKSTRKSTHRTTSPPHLAVLFGNFVFVFCFFEDFWPFWALLKCLSRGICVFSSGFLGKSSFRLPGSKTGAASSSAP